MGSAWSFGRVGTCAVVLGASLWLGACSPSKPGAAPQPPTGLFTTPVQQQLWGDMKPVVSVKELMRDLIDPLADNIFDAVSIVVDKSGTVERVPTTEEDWDRIRIGGTAMAEGVYLLKVKRPFTPAGDKNNSEGAEAVELSPADIMAKVEKDPVEWNARIEALRNVGLEVLDIVKRKDVKELWDASDNLDTACEACHRSYWYPKETPDWYRRLDRRMYEPGTRSINSDRKKYKPATR